jgi:hypothetical protein
MVARKTVSSTPCVDPIKGGYVKESTTAIKHLNDSLREGRDWPTCLFESMALWTSTEGVYRARRQTYFIAGEAFDWLLLAERLCNSVRTLIPQEERDSLLFNGEFPSYFDHSTIKNLLGVEKYRGFLNFFYGITVEEALLLATELEVQKKHEGNGLFYIEDHTNEAFREVYGKSMNELLSRFRKSNNYPSRNTMNVSESKEFTYWLFKYRVKNSDKAKIASDTRKGLNQINKMGLHLNPEDEARDLLLKQQIYRDYSP